MRVHKNTTKYGAPHMTCKKKITNCAHDLLKREKFSRFAKSCVRFSNSFPRFVNNVHELANRGNKLVNSVRNL